LLEDIYKNRFSSKPNIYPMKKLANRYKEHERCELQIEALYINNNRYLWLTLSPDHDESV